MRADFTSSFLLTRTEVQLELSFRGKDVVSDAVLQRGNVQLLAMLLVNKGRRVEKRVRVDW